MNPTRFYQPELDVLRLCAFLFVFFVHRLDLAPVDPQAYYWPYHVSLVGNYGVPLFFFLSAFLITELLTREEERYGKINVKAFYIRRMLRIWPLYFAFFFLMVWLTSATTIFNKRIPTGAQLAFTFFSGNWYITFNNWQSYCINPLWSVSVEEQLYILLPLVLYFTGKKGVKVFSFSAILIAYIAIIYYARRPTKGFSGQWTNSFVQFQFFAAGSLLSMYLKGWQPRWNFLCRAALLVMGYVCWLVASMQCEVNADSPHLATTLQSVSGWLLVLTGVLCFFFTFYGASSRYMPAPLVYLGKISYGMYVVHITMFWLTYKVFAAELVSLSKLLGIQAWKNELGLVLAFAATVTVASLSYRFFEQPFLQLKKRFTFIPSRD